MHGIMVIERSKDYWVKLLPILKRGGTIDDLFTCKLEEIQTTKRTDAGRRGRLPWNYSAERIKVGTWRVLS